MNPWEQIQPWDVELMGEQILDERERARWTQAFAFAGGLPYMWSELARPLCDVIYGLLELRPGDRVLLIGEAVGPSGWLEAIEALVGPNGEVESHEIIREGREAVFQGKIGRSGMRGTWEWTYTRKAPDAAFDAVAVLQATQHCDDWPEAAADFVRVLRPGRRIVLAEAVNAGPAFQARINADIHIRQWYDKIYANLPAAEIPYYSPEDIAGAFGDLLSEPRTMDWRGVEMYWGRKPG
jgi:SAM-dependent methyltransferase